MRKTAVILWILAGMITIITMMLRENYLEVTFYLLVWITLIIALLNENPT